MSFKTFMLNEMPLSNFKYVFHRPEGLARTYSKDATGHFSQQDRAIISHPATVRKLEELLSRHQFKFNIVLYESAQTSYGALIKNILEFMEQNNIPSEGHITFAKNGSSGEPLTIWMMLHTLGHALLPESSGTSTINMLLMNFYHDTHVKGEENEMKMPPIEFLRYFFQFKSASIPMTSTKGLNSLLELEYELVAEYLWNGFIRITPGTKYGYEAQQLKNNLEAEIFKYLQNAVGNVIVDHYAT